MGLSYTLPAAAAAPAPPPIDETAKDLFGYDIYFKKDFQLTPGGDYLRVGGKDNLKAAIYRRLMTRPGEYRFRPEYGCGLQDFVKKKPSTSNLDALKQRIIEQLLQDTRISEVAVDITHETIQDVPTLKVYVKVTAGGNPLTFEPFVFAQEAA
jgi:phage baseplate assembly protein W